MSAASGPGRLVAIFVTPEAGAPMEPRDAVEAIAGAGLAGDRYHSATGTFSGQRRPDHERGVTVIAAEAVAAVVASGVALDAAETRRNLVVEGISPADLDALVGAEFRVGDVVLRGTDLAHPCAYLESLTRPGVREALADRAGLRCEIVTGATLRLGDPVTT